MSTPDNKRSLRENILVHLNPERIPGLLINAVSFRQEIQGSNKEKTPAEIGLALQQLIEADFIKVRYPDQVDDKEVIAPETYELTAKGMTLLGVRTIK